MKAKDAARNVKCLSISLGVYLQWDLETCTLPKVLQASGLWTLLNNFKIYLKVTCLLLCQRPDAPNGEFSRLLVNLVLNILYT